MGALVNYRTEKGVAVLTLNDPPVNAYSYEMLKELDACILEARFDNDVHVIVVTGHGDKFFSAGANINMLREADTTFKYYFCLHANETVTRLEQTPKLCIAAINGHCVGGGLEIALACDMRIARSGDFQFGLPEVALGGAASVALFTGEGVRVRAGVLATQRIGTSLGRGGADLSLLAGRADVCYARTLENELSLGGCAGALAGVVFASGRDLPTVASAEVPWVALAARAEVRWMPADLLAISLALDALIPLLRPRLEVGDGSGGVLAARTLPVAGAAIVLGASLVID